MGRGLVGQAPVEANRGDMGLAAFLSHLRHDGEPPKLIKHTGYYLLSNSLTNVPQAIAALASILFGPVPAGAFH